MTAGRVGWTRSGVEVEFVDGGGGVAGGVMVRVAGAGTGRALAPGTIRTCPTRIRRGSVIPLTRISS